jgi:hypothetical protein
VPFLDFPNQHFSPTLNVLRDPPILCSLFDYLDTITWSIQMMKVLYFFLTSNYGSPKLQHRVLVSPNKVGSLSFRNLEVHISEYRKLHPWWPKFESLPPCRPWSQFFVHWHTKYCSLRQNRESSSYDFPFWNKPLKVVVNCTCFLVRWLKNCNTVFAMEQSGRTLFCRYLEAFCTASGLRACLAAITFPVIHARYNLNTET